MVRSRAGFTPSVRRRFWKSEVLTVQPIIPAHDPTYGLAHHGAYLGAYARAGQVLDGVLGLLAILLAAASGATHLMVCIMTKFWSLLILCFVVLLHGFAV